MIAFPTTSTPTSTWGSTPSLTDDSSSDYGCADEKRAYVDVEHSEAPRVEPLLKEHLDNAFESIEAAFKDDPMRLYITAGKEQTPAGRKVYKRFWKFQHGRFIKRKVAYTVNAGDAVTISTSAESERKKPGPADRTLDLLVNIITKVFLWSNRHEEQVKKLNELRDKMEKLTESELGERAKDMAYVDLLATKPEQQGHGFGSALLNTILFSADIRGRAVYLYASNTANVPFYESFGFVHIADVFLGDENPKWEHPPVAVPLMVREAKGQA